MNEFEQFAQNITDAAAHYTTMEARAKSGVDIHKKIKEATTLTHSQELRLLKRIYAELLGMAPETAHQAAFGISDEQAISDRMELRWSKTAYLKTVQDAYNYTLDNMKENPVNVRSIYTRVKAGYVGQITVNDTIVWESTPKKTAVKALAAADKHFDKVTTRLFA